MAKEDWVDRALGSAATAVADLAKGPAESFGPLKTVLESISILYAHDQVYSYVLFNVLL